MKKIAIFAMLVILLILMVSMSTAISTKENQENKESPLYKIRTKNAIKEKIQTIKTRFFGDRLFFLPFRLKPSFSRDNLLGKEHSILPTGNCACTLACTHQVTVLCGICTEWKTSFCLDCPETTIECHQ